MHVTSLAFLALFCKIIFFRFENIKKIDTMKRSAGENIKIGWICIGKDVC